MTTTDHETVKNNWYVIYAYAAVAAVSQMIWLTYAGSAAVTAAAFGTTEERVGWLSLTYPLLFVVLMVPAGKLLNWNFSKALALGAILTAVGSLIRVGGESYSIVLIGQLVASAGQPFVLNAITGIARRYSTESSRAGAIAVGTAGNYLGMVAAFLLAFTVYEPADLFRAEVLTAVIAVASVAALIWWMRGNHPAEISATDVAVRDFPSLRSVARSPFLRTIALLTFVPYGINGALLTYSQPLLAPSGIDFSFVNIAVISYVGAGVLGCTFIPVLAVKHRWEFKLMWVSATVTAVGCALLATGPGHVLTFAIFAILGLITMPPLAVSLDLIERATGRDDGIATGALWLLGNLGGLVVPLIVGSYLADYMLVFIGLAVSSVVTTLLLLFGLRAKFEQMNVTGPADTSTLETATDGPLGYRHGHVE